MKPNLPRIILYLSASVRTFVAFIFLAGATLNCPAWAQKAKFHNDPKCNFLKHELQRIEQDGQDYINNAPLGSVKTVEDLAASGATLNDWIGMVATNEGFAARRTLLHLDISACQRGISLSDPIRLTEIEQVRTAQIRRAAERWQQMAGEQGKDLENVIVSQLNSLYEAEMKSFYNPEISQFDDHDIGKDYPDLLQSIRGSSLDESTKAFYNENARLLRYEEAGQLANALKGIDKELSVDYAYLLRKSLANRAASAAEQRNQIERQQEESRREFALQKEKERSQEMTTYLLEGLAVLVVLMPLWLWMDRARAKYRAFRTGAKRSSFWLGNAEWIFWEPGETVVLLQHKRLVPMMDPQGGYCTISAWKGQEYRGRISYKTQFSTWTSDPILTSDGLAINLGLGIWWRISNAGTYVSAIASDYHEGNEHHTEDLSEAAEFWIKKLAAGTLREEVNQLPAEKLISPYVQAYLQVRRGPEGELLPEGNALPNFSEQLGKAERKLNEKTLRYGIEIERLEVQELILPRVYQEKLEQVRVAFLEPSHTRALTEAQVIALKGLASVIGEEKVGMIELLKHVNLSHITMNPFTGTIPIVQPVVDMLHQQSERALPNSSRPAASLPSAPQDGKSR
jgi:SPFH domain/Band 7 family protein